MAGSSAFQLSRKLAFAEIKFANHRHKRAANEWQLRQNDIIFSFDGDTQKRPRDKVKQSEGWGDESSLAD